MARAVLREPDLPVATHDEVSREVKLLVDHRDDLVRQRTAIINRFRWHLHRIDPTIDPATASLDRAKTIAGLRDFLAGREGIDARLARELIEDIQALTVRAKRAGEGDHGAGHRPGAGPAGASRLRSADRGEDRR